jgi:hypothetical protein
MDFNAIGRFIVGSYLWDKFYPSNQIDNPSPPTAIDKGLAAVRLIVIAVLAYVVYGFFKKKK